jgi:outer membrane protein assembly factor BamA
VPINKPHVSFQEWVAQIFSFSEKPHDYSLTASNRAHKDFKKIKKNSKAQKDLHITLELMRDKKTLKKELRAKQLKAKITEPKSNRVNTIHQCRTKNQKGRLWFVIKRGELAPIPEIMILGAELLSHNRNSDRINNLAKTWGLPPAALSEFGSRYYDLPKNQQRTIRKKYPQKISEAEPKNVVDNE